MIFLWFSYDFRLGIWMDLGFPSGICHVWGSTVKRVKFPHQPGFGKLAPSPMRNGCNPQGGLLVDRGTQHESKISQRDRTFTSKYGGYQHGNELSKDTCKCEVSSTWINQHFDGLIKHSNIIFDQAKGRVQRDLAWSRRRNGFRLKIMREHYNKGLLIWGDIH